MAVEYEVQWRRGNQGWNGNNRQAETTATMYTITNLTPATYQVRVRAVRDGVPGLWSIPLSAVVTSGTILVATVRADDASIEQGRNGTLPNGRLHFPPRHRVQPDVNVTVSATGNVVLPVNQGAFVQSVGTGGTAALLGGDGSGRGGQCNAGDCRRRVLHWVAVVCGGERVAVCAIHGGGYWRPSVHGRPSDGGGHCGR